MSGMSLGMMENKVNIRLVSTDLDGTLLGNPEATARFKSRWEALPEGSRPVLVYNSGRLVSDMHALVASGLLPEPSFLIGGVGTQLFDYRENRAVEGFSEAFQEGWDMGLVGQIVAENPAITCQPPEFLHPYKDSYFWPGATPAQIHELEAKLSASGLKVTVVYSSHRDLDILPAAADKGRAVEWLCSLLKIPLEQVVVAGDTANDAAMFLLPGVKGIVVENAQPDLLEAVVRTPVFGATRILADGLIEGLENFGVFEEMPPGEEIEPVEIHPQLRALFASETFGSLTDEERALLDEGSYHALNALQKCVSPLGFLAASLEENDVTGTDSNYRSVWARDGAITLINCLFIRDRQFREASRATLCTLLENISPNGQIPSNVRIDDGSPDYSGVGGIASIDGGMWVVIAVYNYVRVTGDLGFLRKFAEPLQRAMNWLAAHDSNNDGLIEVPEAGDWTDLFGRSYNVLYDEVLWFRANVCYGRLMVFLGQHAKAADYLHWSQHIRSEILANFWPSTKQVPGTFADRQFALGDAQYLLAQVSPFGFDWRCDVYANVLAFLTNVIDVDHARTAFRFMWGVGASDPFPVTNLYPPVQSGDPDWKSYYTVNLLNLPGHYHNGGIWPFIGGMWVRFIFRLGLKDVACKELLKLAELNRLGTRSAWEFNEWAHARTGRPMGKRFQAWSAASFLQACHELGLGPDHSRHE